MRSYAPVSLALLLVLLTAFQAHAAATSLLTVTCDAPLGVDMSYGSGLLGLQEDRVETASVAYPDLHPTFVVEEDKPQRLLVTWRAQSARQGPPEPEPAMEAAILYSTDDQITAVAPRGEAVWMYSLFPKLGMGYFVTHNHIPFGYTSPLPGSNREILGVKGITLYSTMSCEVSAKMILKRDTEKVLPKAAEISYRRLRLPSQ